jgi:hypothetical protein
LKKNIEHETVLIYGPPQPMPDAVNARTHLVQMPPGTPTGFPVAQVCREEGTELDTPFTEVLMTHLNAALVQQFLHVSVAAKRPHGRCSGQEAQGKAVVEPDGLLDDGHGKRWR